MTRLLWVPDPNTGATNPPTTKNPSAVPSAASRSDAVDVSGLASRDGFRSGIHLSALFEISRGRVQKIARDDVCAVVAVFERQIS